MFAKPFRLRRRTIKILALVALALVGIYLYQLLFADLPAPDALITRASGSTTKIYDRHGRLLYEIFDPRTGSRTRASLADVPLYLQQATIATEDATFYANPGVSLPAIVRALYQNARQGEIVSGGSTISQQVARLVLMDPQERARRTLTRKLREAILAVRISHAYDKDTILEMYLNEVYYGNMAYGIEAAAQTYFGVHVRDLDLAQCALLAGLPQTPATYDPLVHYDAAKERQQIVLGLMVRQGFISQEQADVAYAEPLHFTGPTDVLHAPHFVAYVRNQLEAESGPEALLAGGRHVTTTLDLDLQQQAEAIVQRRLADLKENQVTSAALVALDPATGQILAMVGSANYGDAGIDGAVNVATALRQPGSTMKPLLYAAAFAPSASLRADPAMADETGPWTPASVVYDVRTAFVTEDGATFIPANYDNVYHGPVTLREALSNSHNMPAVILQKHVGTDVLLDTAHAFGLDTLRDPRRYGLSLTLGGGEVTLLDMTAAYAIFATGGIRIPPTYTPTPTLPHPHTHILSPQVAYLITDILSDNDARAPAFGMNSPLRLSRPAAAKTGTTYNWRDNWTIGYTPDLVVGVWVGNASGAPMHHVSGISGAGPIWHDFMETAHRNIPVHDFDVPDGLVWRDVCPISGLLAGPDCPYSYREVFIAGTEPQAECDQHVTVSIDARTGEPATAHTHPDDVVEQIYWIAPPELREWARAHGIPQLQGASLQDTSSQVASLQGASSPTLPYSHTSTLISLTSPDPNSIFGLVPYIPRENQRISVQAEVYTGEWPQRVILYADGQALAELNQPPYSVPWTLETGEHTFHAVAVARDGSLIESKPITILVEEG